MSVLYLRERCCYLGYAYRISWVFYPVSVSYVSRLPPYYLSGGAFLLIARRGLSDALRMRRLHRGAMCASYLVGILRIFGSPLIIFLIIWGLLGGLVGRPRWLTLVVNCDVQHPTQGPLPFHLPVARRAGLPFNRQPLFG